MKKATAATKKKEIRRNWYLFDVSEKILGREATDIAQKLMGKGKPYFVPYLDCGDYVVVINSSQVEVTGKKKDQKEYQKFSGYPAGRKVKKFAQVIKEKPERIIYQAVAGMLPKNKLRQSMLKRLYIYPGSEHPYQSKFETA